MPSTEKNELGDAVATPTRPSESTMKNGIPPLPNISKIFIPALDVATRKESSMENFAEDDVVPTPTVPPLFALTLTIGVPVADAAMVHAVDVPAGIVVVAPFKKEMSAGPLNVRREESGVPTMSSP